MPIFKILFTFNEFLIFLSLFLWFFIFKSIYQELIDLIKFIPTKSVDFSSFNPSDEKTKGV